MEYVVEIWPTVASLLWYYPVLAVGAILGSRGAQARSRVVPQSLTRRVTLVISQASRDSGAGWTEWREVGRDDTSAKN